MAPGGYSPKTCYCGMTVCNCERYERQSIAVFTNSVYEPPKDVRELEIELTALRKELASTKAELFRLRNRRK